MNRLRHVAAAVLAVAWAGSCSDLAIDQTGIELTMEVDDGRLFQLLTDAHELRLAAWVGVVPGVGVRPTRILHREGSDDPTELCTVKFTEGGIVSGVYVCDSRLHLAADAQLYVGAFYELSGSENGVPQDGEFLAYVGPVTRSPGADRIGGIDIVMLNPYAPQRPDFATVLADVQDAVVRGKLGAFMTYVHPFYGDVWQNDVDDFSAWLSGSFATAATRYADPLSAPAAGLLSAAVRNTFDMSDFTITEISRDANLQQSLYVAQWDVSYMMKSLAVAPNRFGVTERWDLRFRGTDDAILLERLFVDRQGVADFVVSGEFTGEVINVSWTGSAAGYEVELDRFAPATRTWTFAEQVTVSAETDACAVAEGSTCLDPGPLDDSAFYRVQVRPISAADVTGPASTVFAPGINYNE